MVDHASVVSIYHRSKSVRTGIELLLVFVRLAIIYTIFGVIFGWPSLLASGGSWPIFLGGLIIIVGCIVYGLFVETPRANQPEERD